MKKDTRKLNNLAAELQVLGSHQANNIKGGDDKRPLTPAGTGCPFPLPAPPAPLPNAVIILEIFE